MEVLGGLGEGYEEIGLLSDRECMDRNGKGHWRRTECLTSLSCRHGTQL